MKLGIQESRIIKFQKVLKLGDGCRMMVMVVKILKVVVGVDDGGDVDDGRRR